MPHISELMIDWRYRFSQEPLENFYLELGLYRLNREGNGMRWIETPLVDKIKSYTKNSRMMIGELQKETVQI